MFYSHAHTCTFLSLPPSFLLQGEYRTLYFSVNGQAMEVEVQDARGEVAFSGPMADKAEPGQVRMEGGRAGEREVEMKTYRFHLLNRPLQFKLVLSHCSTSSSSLPPSLPPSPSLPAGGFAHAWGGGQGPRRGGDARGGRHAAVCGGGHEDGGDGEGADARGGGGGVCGGGREGRGGGVVDADCLGKSEGLREGEKEGREIKDVMESGKSKNKRGKRSELTGYDRQKKGKVREEKHTGTKYRGD